MVQSINSEESLIQVCNQYIKHMQCKLINEKKNKNVLPVPI